ncbi:MAG: DUF1902 domain-containing protein [Schwartzia sp.]|nr:DUF1902 domain-containing protein [Schwartzia sp. (in: firmicutes)]MBO6236570.1 DUF1902 domain-containing protein [Schwartzia sp. (in: firmicutes)]
MDFYNKHQKDRAEYLINFIWDDEAHVWVAICDDIPLALESESLDELIKRVRLTAPEIIKLNKLPQYEEMCFSMNRHEKMVFA